MNSEKLEIIYNLIRDRKISCEEFIKLMDEENVNTLQPVIIPVSSPYTTPYYVSPFYTTITCSNDGDDSDKNTGSVSYTLT